MTKKELVRAIQEEANRQAGEDPQTWYVVAAKAAIAVIEGLEMVE